MGQALSYSQSVLATDSQFVGRVASILKDEGFSPVGESAGVMALKYSGDVASKPDIAEAYHAALLAERADAAAARAASAPCRSRAPWRSFPG